MDPRLAKRIDHLYRNCKQMPLLCILGLFVPIILLFVAPLSLVYAAQRSRLLREVKSIDLAASDAERRVRPTPAEQVSYLQNNGISFYAPLMIMAGLIPIIALILLT